MDKFIETITPYKVWIQLAGLILVAAIVFVLIYEIGRVVINMIKTYTHSETKETILNKNLEKESVNDKGVAIRKIVAADSIDPRPSKHMIINYGSKEVYVRTFTVASMPKRVDFATTFASLQNFKNCCSSFFVHPLSEAAMSAKIDRHNTVLEAEYMSTKDNNRRRRLSQQRNESEILASEIETGRTKLFSVGFLFTLVADSLKELNSLSDLFKSEASGKGIEISNCYSLQEEAYLANAPLNSYMGKNSKQGVIEQYIAPSAAKFWLMDKKGVSTLYNYTQSSFSHKKGIPLGVDLFTRKPIIYNIYDPSHTSFCGCFYGHMGSGKSLMIKTMCIRNRLFNYRFVALDGQRRKGLPEGEYAREAIMMGGYNFQLSSTSGNILNIFDVSESLTIVQDELTGILKEVTTLELTDTKKFIVSTLVHIMQGDKPIEDFSLYTYIKNIITTNVTKLYDNFGIENGNADSLYEIRETEGLTSGNVKKEMPTLTDFFKLIVIGAIHNEDSSLKEAYDIITASLSDYVKEVYYSEKSAKFYTREEYLSLPSMISERTGVEEKYDNTQFGQEIVKSVRGTRTYFDGQSTLTVNPKQCPFLNIDLSMLQEDEKPIARIIGMGFLNEYVIKKNSESLSSADKLLCIIDEFHEIIKDAIKTDGVSSSANDSSVLDTVENIIRTARKRNVGMLLCTQTVREFTQNPQCEKIAGLMTFSVVFKQPIKDRDLIQKQFGITEAQANMICDGIGGNSQATEEDKKKHRGEACLIENETKKVCFLKGYYFEKVEGTAVATDADEITALFGEKLVKGA